MAKQKEKSQDGVVLKQTNAAQAKPGKWKKNMKQPRCKGERKKWWKKGKKEAGKINRNIFKVKKMDHNQLWKNIAIDRNQRRRTRLKRVKKDDEMNEVYERGKIKRDVRNIGNQGKQ